MTKHETIAGLIATGHAEQPTSSRKYRVFTKIGLGRTMLVGKAGALRWVGTGEPISMSHSITGSRMHHAYAAVGRRAECYSSPEQAYQDYLAMQAGKQEIA